MKRALAILLALVLALGCVPAFAAAEAATFSPAAAPGVTETVTTVDTGIPGLTLSIGADDWSVGEAENITSTTGVTYPHYLTGKANPNFEEGTGTYFSFTLDDSVQTGSLEIMYRLNSGKGFYILDNGQAMEGYDGMKLDVSADTSSTIIVEGGHTYTVYARGSKLRLYGCTFQNVDPKEVFAQEIAAFPFERIMGTNADVDHVDENLTLVDSYESQFGSCDVSWTTSDASVIDVDGTVNCQKADATVTLTGHFSVQERREFAADVTFTITVLGDPDDASAVAVAAQALTLGDLSGVKRDLTLPAKGKRGATVTWASSNQSVVSADGKVYPAPNQDQSATLTATIQRGEATQTKDFAVTVAGIVPVTLDSWAYSDGSHLRYTPVDGGYLLNVNLTCNDPNPDPDDVVTVSVYAADGTLKDSRDIGLVESSLGGPLTGESICFGVGLPMDSGDYFEMTARNTRTGAALITPVRNDDALTQGAKIYVVGDSTASVYGDDRYPRKGWAQMLESYFDGVEVVDLALSGRASRSFKSEANYTTLKNSLKKGDYLIIQFGHNDDKADAYADPNWDFTESRFDETSYQSSMFEYIQLAWEKGAHPIIATSISRRKLSDEGLEKYVRAARMLSEATSVPCVDLYASTNGWINAVGVDEAQDMFNCVKPYDSRFMSYPWFLGSEFAEKGSSDDTHINLYGAELISQWFVDALKDQGHPLAAKVNDHRAAPLPSYAQATSVEVKDFADMTGHWANQAVRYLASQNILQGTDDTHFSPDVLTTRAMIATLLWRMAGQPTPRARMADFPDVEADSWYTQAVRWCAEAGIVTGYDNGNFGPADPITREQLAVMVYRYAQAHGLDAVNAPLSFADADAVSPWAREAIIQCAIQGLITGKPADPNEPTGFPVADPAASATRAETAVILQRLAAVLGK